MRLTHLLLLGACLVVTGCATPDGGTSSAEPPFASAPAPAPTAAPPEEGDPPPGWDEPLDGDVPADADLDDDALLELLRTPAQAASSSEHCEPTEVAARLEGFDMWLGHRATWLTVRNTSDRTCVVEGVPGVGARGERGHGFALTVGSAATGTEEFGPVTLAVGAEAQAMVEWTGALAGAEDERVSMLVFQLASDQAPIGVAATIEDDPDLERGEREDTEAYVPDLGMFSTVKVTPFQPAA